MIINRVITNTSWIIGGRFIQMILSLIISMFIARYLGPTNFGVINYTASFVALFTAISTLGLDAIIVNELVSKPKSAGEILGTGIAMRLISALLSVVSIFVIISFINPGDELLLYVAFLQSLSLIFKVLDTIVFWFQYRLESKFAITAQLLAYIIVMIYKIIILVMSKSIVWFAASTSIEALLISLFLLVLYKKNSGEKFKISFEIGKKMISKSYYFIIAGIMATIYTQIDKIMIGKMLDTTSVGFYSAAVAVCVVWAFVPLAVIESLRPIIMELSEKNPALYIRRLKQLFAIIIWISLLFSGIVAILGKWLVLLLFGSQYLGAETIIYIYSWSAALSYLGNARSLWLICENKHKYVIVFSLLGATCNIIMNLGLIPTFGVQGAAFATLLTQIVINLIIPFAFKDTRLYPKYIIQSFLLKNIVSVEEMKIMKDYFLRRLG